MSGTGGTVPGYQELAIAEPDALAAIFPSLGLSLTRQQLNDAANRAANLLRARGLEHGDCVAISITNRPEFLVALLAAQRSGLYYVLLSTKLSIADARYILADSEARLAIVSAGSFAAEDEDALRAAHPQIIGIGLGGKFPDWDAELAGQPTTLPDNPSRGVAMLYSSGTTGRPKGMRKQLPPAGDNSPDPENVGLIAGSGAGPQSVFYLPCPLYHAAPHRFASAALSAGATLVVPARFDAAEALAHIERYRVTHSMWVPTMFHRMLRLPEAVRLGHDLSSHRVAIHGAAPCPVPVKRAMIEWWGPILDEYYSGSEGIGATRISSAEWLAHPGSVGRPRGCRVHILGPDGRELPAGEVGDIYFESDTSFEYWRDPAKTRASTDGHGWRTFGDVGSVDADGYLYLAGRRHFTIISGGVNIYPEEVEAALLASPLVQDVAVIGVADADYGEAVLAVVQLTPGVAGDDATIDALQQFARAHLGPVKAPKRFELVQSLPRQENGKLYKQELIARFAGQ